MVADWIQIISAPLTIISVYWAWRDRLNNLQPSVNSNSVMPLFPYTIAMSLVALAWIFFFSIYVRLVIKWTGDVRGRSFLLPILAAIIGFIFFMPVEMLFLQATLPQTPSATTMSFWIGIPLFLWAISAFIVWMSSAGTIEGF